MVFTQNKRVFRRNLLAQARRDAFEFLAGTRLSIYYLLVEKTPNQRPALRISHQESATTNQRPHNQNQRPHFTDQRPHRRISDHESTTTTQRLHASH